MSQESWEQTPSLLEQIREGMEVYDQHDEHVGTVEEVFFGATAGYAAERGQGAATAANPDVGRDDSLIEEFAEVFAGPQELPEVVRNQLLRNGFVRIEGAGLFGADRYVLPDHIAGVSGNRVILRVARDELIKG